MLSWLFRKMRGPVELAVDMVGVRLGDRFLQVGVGLPLVFGRLAGKAGLSGRACGIAADAASARALEDGAASEGSYAEVVTAAGMTAWPFEAGSFDVALVDALLLLRPESAPAVLSELRRCLRPGGRAVVLHQRPRGLIQRLGYEGTRPVSGEAAALETMLGREGFVPVRVLAEREGLGFIEGFRAA